MSALRAGAAIQRPLGGLGGLFLTGRTHPDTLTVFRDPLNISKTTLEDRKREKRRTQAERETRKNKQTDIHYSAHKSTPTRTHTFTLNIRTDTHKEININSEFAPYS